MKNKNRKNSKIKFRKRILVPVFIVVVLIIAEIVVNKFYDESFLEMRDEEADCIIYEDLTARRLEFFF
ncbi:hypothetical protein IJH66_01745 [Candidatus Saccharibacteria bacterium]|nr:hypothetical protein [Candidatus Saccharibacteria bacterium]